QLGDVAPFLAQHHITRQITLRIAHNQWLGVPVAQDAREMAMVPSRPLTRRAGVQRLTQTAHRLSIVPSANLLDRRGVIILQWVQLDARQRLGCGLVPEVRAVDAEMQRAARLLPSEVAIALALPAEP